MASRIKGSRFREKSKHESKSIIMVITFDLRQ